MSDKNPHDGHRSRMRQRYLEHGFDGFQDHEILEMILYNCYRRRNTNDISHKLLETFGSISAVVEAPVDSLIEAGVSESVAVTLKMIPDICRVYYDDRNNRPSKIIQFDELCDYFIHKFIGRFDEVVYLLLMDSKKRELFCGVVATGTNCASDVPLRKIVDFALRYGASNAVIAHNHPSGIALPSRMDLQVTNILFKTLESVGVRLVDHIIVADDDCVSLRDSELCNALIVYDD